ncbi:MAG TPA: hypothetical protein VNL96_08155, partial [Gemmatimonadaceae bacterium]|nr:hypothetical protein [Gemmatimonadaceae bacterium]
GGAMIGETMEQMSRHVEFLGYEVTRDDKLVKARHTRKYNLIMKPLAGGVLFTCIFSGSENAHGDRAGYLELVNALNNRAGVARFYADKDSDLFVEAWHPDHYERGEFGEFMESWDRDCLLLAQSGAERFLL